MFYLQNKNILCIVDKRDLEIRMDGQMDRHTQRLLYASGALLTEA